MKKRMLGKPFVAKIIKIRREDRSILEGYQKKKNGLATTIETLSQSLADAGRQLWDTIEQHYPETKNMRCTYDSQKHKITIVGHWNK